MTSLRSRKILSGFNETVRIKVLNEGSIQRHPFSGGRLQNLYIGSLVLFVFNRVLKALDVATTLSQPTIWKFPSLRLNQMMDRDTREEYEAIDRLLAFKKEELHSVENIKIRNSLKKELIGE